MQQVADDCICMRLAMCNADMINGLAHAQASFALGMALYGVLSPPAPQQARSGWCGCMQMAVSFLVGAAFVLVAAAGMDWWAKQNAEELLAS